MTNRDGDDRSNKQLLLALLNQTDYLDDEIFGKMVRIALNDVVRNRPKRNMRGHDELTLYEWVRVMAIEWIERN